MALAPINPTNLTPPRVEFIDPRSGAISREWYRFFLSLLTATQANQEDTTLAPDAGSLLATYDALLASATQASEVTSDGMVASLESELNSLQDAFGVTPPDLGGTVTSVAASGGTTGLTFTGSPITTNGTLTLGGTLAVANGGTGATTAAAARTNLGAAASGANTDITALDQDVTITATGTIAVDSIGFRGLPQNSQTASYTLALTDAGKHISITTGGVVIPANGSVAFPIGATIVVFNNSASTQTISITTDTLRQAGTTNTGTRTLAVYGLATLVKMTSTVWVVTGNVT
jgi:hypothetical protein